MNKYVRPVNIWRAWNVRSNEPVFLVATFDPDAGLYSRLLNEARAKAVGQNGVCREV